jgi:hypothetical protein
MIRKGEPWGEPADGPADLTVSGSDGDLAAALRDTPPGILVSFVPSPGSDVARAVGLTADAPGQGLALPMDALEIGADGTLAVNAVVLGTPPDRLRVLDGSAVIRLHLDGREEATDPATTVVVATGQWLRGVDLVPRGHPGDGRAEVQVYSLARGQRRAMRDRLPTGTHLPHADILTRSAVSVAVEARRRLPLEIDGQNLPPTAELRVVLVPARYRLLI